MIGKNCSIMLLAVIGTLSLSAAPSTQIMSLEYFYAKDGTITGRSVNGRMQTYQYDKRGQLLAVVDGNGQAVEKYVYDRAGNILEKTVNGVTTTYTYDKANQLVSSSVEGKVTSYRYDAAGRLVKEGDKSYRYGYLDKVLAVYENGENTANFDYHLGGQIASATRNGETENFTWDGLALIHRGSNTFINEPYVTGGNPLLSSKGGVMFNDMLGSTLGVNGKQGVDAISMTAFGETDDKSAFFTGKPAVGELGFAFLFRNYRAEQGKWQTADPLGYPNGWNNSAYVNNKVTRYIDWLGAYEIEWEGTWTQSEKDRVISSMNSTKTRMEILVAQITAQENAINSSVSGATELLAKLATLKAGLQKTIGDINSTTYNLEIYQRNLGSEVEASYWASPVFWYDDELTINNGSGYSWFDNGSFQTIFHELTHTWSDDGESSNDYINAHMIESLYTTDLINWVIYYSDYRNVFGVRPE